MHFVFFDKDGERGLVCVCVLNNEFLQTCSMLINSVVRTASPRDRVSHVQVICISIQACTTKLLQEIVRRLVNAGKYKNALCILETLLHSVT